MRFQLRQATAARRHGAAIVRVVVVALLFFGAPLIAQEQQPAPKQEETFVPVSQLPAQDQLPAAPLLVTAYGFVWVVLFGYVVSVSRRLSGVKRDVARLESDIKRGTRA